jgi:PAS domain S-box-containing protein
MEKKLLDEGVRSVVNGRFDIIYKSKVFRFSGSYSVNKDSSITPEFSQFDLLFSIDDENYLVHPADVAVVERLFTHILPEQMLLQVRLITKRGQVLLLSGEGLVRDFQSDANQSNTQQVQEGKSTLMVNDKVLKQAGEIALHQDMLQKDVLAQTLENKYRILFNSIDDGFSIVEVILDEENKPKDYLFVEINPAFERLTGLQNAVGKTMKSLQPQLEQFWFDTYAHVAQSGQPVSFVNVAHELGGRWFEVYAFPVSGKEKNQVAIVLHDVTERRQVERNRQELNARLQELNAQLRDLDTIKNEFFSNISHEFRTPLTLIINPLEDLIEKGRVDGEDLTHLSMAHRNALRMQKTINMLLDFFRIESGRMEPRFEETNLSDLTVDIASNFRSTIEAAGLKFIVKKLFPRQMAFVDRELWEKIVVNLISNAFKFTHEGSIRVSIVSHRNMLQLKVRDTGIGISKEDMPKIFERFARIEGATARTSEGSGIGLAFVKELVKMHGGTIEVESEPGKGSQFTVSIPKGRDHLSHVLESDGTTKSQSTKASFTEEINAWLPDERNGTLIDSDTGGAEERASVMIVDDNADMREYLLHTLTNHFVVIPAENGAQALRYLSNVRPDLILTDMMMPEMDGKTLLTELRKTKAYAHIPIVVLSARTGENLKSETLQLGADDYIAKPFSVRELIATLSARIEVGRMRAKTEKEIARKHLELEQLVLDRTKELVRSREDLTHANEVLKQKNYELMAMNEELTNFAFIASHDLREPLRKVTLFSNELSSMASDALIPGKAKEFAQKIFTSVTRMNALLDDVLDFSRMRSRSQLKYTKVNLNNVVGDVLKELSDLIKENEAVLKVGDLPTITANPVQIYHLFENLLSNAVKFRTAEHGSEVRIFAEVLKKGDNRLPFPASDLDYLKIAVSDNGIGFEPQYAERIFHMFQRLHRTSEYSGTGMGLAICRKVMQNHKGYILAEGQPGKGATFSCYFPLERS